MNRIRILAALIAVSSPMLVMAQTANTPGGSAATGTPLDQTKTSTQRNAPANTGTSPTSTNPTGSLSNAPSDTDPATTSKMKSSKRMSTKGANTTQPGDVPTYPAPAKDGTPTK